ncbi:MAG: hypothetical protein CMJ49_11530 [Planctomycetaceae bacterium]|nr:hypothetical protein [Planctomycetaceae bacterium]
MFDSPDHVITIIGRGHSGTRAISKTLHDSGVFMGEPQNPSSDLIPPEDMYEACRVMAHHVKYRGDMRWDLAKLHTMPIDPAFTRLIESFLSSVIASDAAWRGWKIPETTLCYPWIARLFPDIRYIHWVRDPRDGILNGHTTDDLARFGVPYPRTDNIYLQRAISWKYQAQIMADTPRPRRMLRVRLEDFVTRQQATLTRLQRFLGFPLEAISVRPQVVGRWRRNPQPVHFNFYQAELRSHGYLRGPRRTAQLRQGAGS